MKIIVKLESYKKLLYDAYKYQALRDAGVDNWTWYSDALCDWIDNFNSEHNTICETVKECVDIICESRIE